MTSGWKGLAAALFLLWGLAGPLTAGEDPRAVWQLLEVVPADQAQVQRLREGGFDLLEAPRPGEPVRLLAAGEALTRLRELGFAPRVLVEDYGRRLAEAHARDTRLAAAEDFAYGSMGGYFSPDEVRALVDSLRAADRHGIIGAPLVIGRSLQGREIWVVKVSDHPELDEDEPEVLFNSLIHAREGMSLMSLLYFLRWLAGEYGSSDSVTALVDSRELYFLPVVNPDGFDYNWRQYRDYHQFSLWRKNARDNNGNGRMDFDLVEGVDLNRNFDFKWGLDNIGSSSLTSAENYRGASRFSEPESRAFAEFVRGRSFSGALNLHSLGRLLVYPFGYADLLTPDSLEYKRLAALLTAENKYVSGNALNSYGLYPVNGECTDWLYADSTKGRIMAWTAEVSPSIDWSKPLETLFWPPRSQITLLARETLAMQYRLAALSAFWPEPGPVTVTADPREPRRFRVFTTFSNAGLAGPREPVSLRLEPLSGAVSLPRGITTIAGLAPGASAAPPADTLVAEFGETSYRATVALALYEGERRLRAIPLTLDRTAGFAPDVDGNGRTNIFDLLGLLRGLAGSGHAPSAERCDVDRNSRVDIFDLLALLQLLR